MTTIVNPKIITPDGTSLNLTDLSDAEHLARDGDDIDSEAGGPGDVTAAANITAQTVVIGDDGAKGVKKSEVTITDLAGSAITISTATAATTISITPKEASSGNGATVNIRGGSANQLTGSGDGGPINVDAGSKGPDDGGTDGAVNLGVTFAEAVNICRSGKVATIGGPTYANDNIALPKASGKGLQVDSEGTPTFGWHDLLGPISIRGAGGTDPAFNRFNSGTIRQFQFEVGEEVFINFHIPHDYLPGSDMFLHFHWAQDETRSNGASTNPLSSGSVTWGAEHQYAKGHEQAAYSASKTITVVGTPTVFTKAEHYITEVQLSAASPSASQIDSDDLEVDGLILMRLYLSANNLVMEDEGTQCHPYLMQVDIHYQSTGMATKDKAPNFYT